MLISYQYEDLRDCCLLLKPASLNSSFTSTEIKNIRACVADLRAAPKLTDSPLIYQRNFEKGTVEIINGSIKIIIQIISSYESPRDDQIERLKIVEILNIDLQVESKQKRNNK